MLNQREVTRRAPQRLDSTLTPNGALKADVDITVHLLWHGIYRTLPEVGLVASGDCSLLVSCRNCL